MSKLVPKGYEEIFGDTIIQRGYKFLSSLADEWLECSTSIGKTVTQRDRRIIRKITKPLCTFN